MSFSATVRGMLYQGRSGNFHVPGVPQPSNGYTSLGVEKHNGYTLLGLGV